MKKFFFSAALLMAASSAVMAQSSIDTYDVCDANLNGEVSVADATTVVNQVLANTPGSVVVTAEDLNALLQLIDSRLSALDGRLSAIDSQLSAIQTQLGEALAKPDASGLYSNGHEYVDLGLTDAQGRTIYWATCNVGAESPEDYGLYFAWGDTEGHGSNKINGTPQPDGYYYNWANCPFNNGSSSYNSSYFATVKDEVCPDGILAPSYDAAHVQWGGDWRMPTMVELGALRTQCTWTWDSGKKGYIVKGNGNSIFLPASGYRGGSDLDVAGSDGYYWSSSLDASLLFCACGLYFGSSYQGPNSYSRYYGLTVRPVLRSAE